MFFFLFSVITLGEGERVIKLDSCNFHLLDFIARKKLSSLNAEVFVR